MSPESSPFACHRPEADGLYDPAFEHDACGTGFVADQAGRASHVILQKGLEALANLAHRGAVGADAHSGDGAGVLTQLPEAFFREVIAAQGHPTVTPGALAVGMGFFPSDARAAGLTEQAMREQGLGWVGWREVPTRPEALGEQARASMPRIRQWLVTRGPHMTEAAFARALYLARRTLERRALDAGLPELYVCSLSHRTLVYKALVMSEQLRAFYPDLEDATYETALCVFHQRFSTNTWPTWALAQPFRLLGHNGEINTLSGNRTWMEAREGNLGGDWELAERERLLPVIQAGGSDSAALDNVLELLVASGRNLLHAVRMLVPEAQPEGEAAIAFYAYHAGLMEPWDGPAALSFSDGKVVGACLDRNGLRPARWCATEDGLVVLGSEAGLVDLGDARVVAQGRLGPGQMLAIDTASGALWTHEAIVADLAAHKPYAAWLAEERVMAPSIAPNLEVLGDRADLVATQRAFGYTSEDLERLLIPMATDGKEPVGSMGDDTPLAVFSAKPRPLFHFFKQRFAQVTNPPIDPLREPGVMSLVTILGARQPWLAKDAEPARSVQMSSPLLNDAELAWLRQLDAHAFRSHTLDATWDTAAGAKGLGATLSRLGEEAVEAVRTGARLLIVSDRGLNPHRAPVPMPLAVAGVHKTLVREGLRLEAGLVAECGEAREDHHIAVLLGFGADAVNPYLAFRTVAALAVDGKTGASDLGTATRHYRQAIELGLTKIMAKMGICTIASYRGARVFEAIGLHRDLVARFFPGTPSLLGGLDLDDLAKHVLEVHAGAWQAAEASSLDDWGLFRYRPGGEYHQLNPHVFKAIQQVGKRAEAIADLAALIDERPTSTIRDLLDFAYPARPMPLDEVEPAASIVKRFVASAMSLGALSPEAHSVIAIAMNRLGAKSNSGEGGEDASRFVPRPDGDNANSLIKQVAAGRFGVTPAYLASADEIEIKMAQGAKPGEGGQLPGFKVNAEIAQLRHATPGTSLISPPPHHDIYSIEDLAQLIHDLRQVNPAAAIAVKLVSVAGVGTIAAGVAKAHADVVHVSGHDGGTGASPLGSIKHAGAPWELGLAEVQQVLVKNGLRGRVRVRVDGGFKSGRDVLVGAMLGADEFAFGTALVVAAGCVMARQCHQNICPVGIASQDPALRARFKGTPDQIVNYLMGVAEDVRKGLAALGLTRLEQAIGRVDLLTSRVRPNGSGATLDLGPLLTHPAPEGGQPLSFDAFTPRSAVGDVDAEVRAQLGDLPADARYTGHFPVRNTMRSLGARLAGAIAARHGDHGFKGQIVLCFSGTAGQSFGAFGLAGMTLTLKGAANDYVAKGLAGGTVVVRPAEGLDLAAFTLVGNTVLYGATAGKLFVAGGAGERFAVRNSGAHAVVESVGDHGCEYMTRGTVVVLGPVGRNFGAGMTGGMAYVHDPDGTLADRVNRATVALDIPTDEEAIELKALVAQHAAFTDSPRARALLANWAAVAAQFAIVRGQGQPVAPPVKLRSLPTRASARPHE